MSSIRLKSIHLIIMRSLLCFNLLYNILYSIIKVEIYVKMNFFVVNP